ncbi:uncharacterized protein [Periplaneta americana]|uniref:uncharacterized protein n=1 Tax=Periplaneta americana TaxID=6978 RepID=UPI0037E891B8
MKLILAVLSLCVLATGASAQQAPLCDVFSFVTNETWLMQAVMGVMQQNYRPLECLAGCVFYTVNLTFGDLIKSRIGVPYALFETCLKKGVRSHDTCEITECALESATNGIRLAQSLGLKIPYLDVIQQIIDTLTDQPHIVLMDEHTLPPPQAPVVSSNLSQQAPQKTQESQPTEPKAEMHPATNKPTETATQKLQQDEPIDVKKEKVNSAPNMIPTFGLLHICGLLLFFKNVY